MKVENLNNPGITIGRVRKRSSDDEACISALLDYFILNPYTVTYVALSDSDRSFRSSMNGFDVRIRVSCSLKFSYDVLITFLSGYNISGLTLA